MSKHRKSVMRQIMRRAWYLVRCAEYTLRRALIRAWQEYRERRAMFGEKHVEKAMEPNQYRPTSVEFMAYFASKLCKVLTGRGHVVVTPAMANALMEDYAR